MTTTALTLAEVRGLSNEIIQARDMLPAHIQTPGQALAIMLTGQELGLPPMQSLRQLHMVKGKVSLSAEAMLALAIKAGIKHQWVETNPNKAVLRLARSGYEPYTHTYTMGDAKTAGNSGGMYGKYPAEMLRARCISGAIRAYCPDILSGTYTPQEMGEIFDVTPEPVRRSETAALDDFTSWMGRPAYQHMDAGAQEAVRAWLQTARGADKWAQWQAQTGASASLSEALGEPLTKAIATTPPPIDDDEPIEAEVVEERVEREDPPGEFVQDDANDMPDF